MSIVIKGFSDILIGYDSAEGMIVLEQRDEALQTDNRIAFPAHCVEHLFSALEAAAEASLMPEIKAETTTGNAT